jgi:hypothetical protein
MRLSSERGSSRSSPEKVRDLFHELTDRTCVVSIEFIAPQKTAGNVIREVRLLSLVTMAYL